MGKASRTMGIDTARLERVGRLGHWYVDYAGGDKSAARFALWNLVGCGPVPAKVASFRAAWPDR